MLDFPENDLNAQLRLIKRSLHGMMNGPVSNSMRQMGLSYKVNFGVELPRLQAFAAELPHTYDLAAALWKEHIRECRILAGMVMPREAFDSELAELWIEQMEFTEEAECTVMHLFVYLRDASDKAFEWIAAETDMKQVCGFLLIGRLLSQGARLTERDEMELLDHVRSALSSPSPVSVRRAAQKALFKFMDAGGREERLGDALLTELEK